MGKAGPMLFTWTSLWPASEASEAEEAEEAEEVAWETRRAQENVEE